MHTVLAHHDPSDPDFHSHVLMIGENAFCIGCTASKTFVHLILPFLILFTIITGIETAGYIEAGLLIGLVLSTIITTLEMKRGIPSRSELINSIPPIFLTVSILYVGMSSTSIILLTRILISAILAAPQLGLYVYKIYREEEFSNKSIKFISRLLFIIGFYFALVGTVDAPVLSLAYIAIAALVFVRLRKFSSFRVQNNSVAIISQHKVGQQLSSSMKHLSIIDSDGFVTSKNTLLVFLLFFIGIFQIFSFGESGTCNNTLQTVSAAPLLMMSNRPKFCPSCGDPVDINEIYCDNCGIHIGGDEQPAKPLDNRREPTSQQNNYNQGSYNQRGYDQRRYSQGGYNQGGYYGNNQRYGRRGSDLGMGVIIGAGIVIFLFALFITNSFVIAILAGLLASGGLLLASSTDNCCMQYLILDCCSDCICGLIAGYDD